MRKLKSLLFTAGIAAVLAIGVGAGVTTSNRDAIRADAATGDTYSLVSALEDGAKYIIGQTKATATAKVNTGVMSDFYSSKTYFKVADAFATNDVIPWSASFNELTAVASGTNWKFKLSDGTYLAYTGSKNTLTHNADGDEWMVTIDSTSKDADIKKTTADRFIRFNESDNKFAAYKSSSSVQTKVKFYKFVENVSPTSVLDKTSFSGDAGNPNVELSVSSSNYTPTTYTWSTSNSAVVDFDPVPTNKDSKASIKLVGEGTANISVIVSDGTNTFELICAFTLAPAQKIYTVGEFKDTLAVGKTNIKVQGVLADINGSNAYIADAETGRAISAYKIDKLSSMKIGDEVLLSGDVGEYPKNTNHLQLTNGKLISTINQNVAVKAKTYALSELKDANYNDIITVNDLKVKSIDDVTSKGKVSKKITLTDGKNNIEYYVNDFKVADKFNPIKDNLNDSVTYGNKVNVSGPYDAKTTHAITVSTNSNIEFGLNDEGLTLSANRWASAFVNALNLECGKAGSTPYTLSEETWNTQAASYAKLSNEDKAAFKTVAANENGTVAQQAVSSHNYVVAKYSYNNFMEIPNSGLSNVSNLYEDNVAVIISITVIAILSVSAIAMFAISKRKKATR